ncbi:hypothetical protein [Piscinibacter sp.]|jgi:hypothetical protein|uniref:hypothetical protein n=1 Tax=Piscinibacter sp. TaxID=1903157 RepID=UPI002F3F41FB
MSRSRLLATPLKTALAASLLLASSAGFAQSPTEAELARKLDQLAAELANVKAQLAQLQQQRAAPTPTASPAPAATPVVASPPPRPAEPATVLSSYGEINYNRPTRASQNAQADVRRFVLGAQHRFDAKTKVVTELEVEHAVSSADDSGEVEVEQAYIEHQLTPTWAVRGGLFLMPVGLLNENHEPTAYYGVERNFVETAIIPTTWREGGLQIVGSFDNGLTLQTGLSTGFDLSKWDASSSEGAESPLGAIHQELSLAKARDLSVFGALNWRGIPGLQLGGSLFTGGATHGQAAASARVTLWDVHARWTPGRWDLATLYSRGGISNTAALNAALVGNPTLIPKSFDGWYAQAAYKVWSHEDYALWPFVRYEQFNTARSFADLGPGLTPAGAATERVVTVGANFQLTPGVVLKADLQRFRENKDANRVDLGIGWSF